MAMGIPVVGPDNEPVREVFESGTHLLLAEQDGRDFIELIERIIGDKELMNSLAIVGRRYVEESFAWSDNALRLINFLKRRVENPRNARMP